MMVKYTAENVTVRTPSKPPAPFSKSPSMASIASLVDTHHDVVGDPSNSKYESLVDTPKYETKTAYYSAGSGIPEVKVILGGFVIKGFLGIKTLIVKSIGMVILFNLFKFH
jgi:chloride channel 3/4/5